MNQKFLDALRDNYKIYYSLVYSIVQNHNDVEDVFQDVCLRILSYEFKTDIQNVNAYLTKIVKNAAIDYKKKTPNHVSIDEINFEPISSDDDFLLNELYTDMVRACFVFVPEKVRPALLEHFLKDIPLTVLSKKYDISRKTLRYWKSNFIKKAKIFFK